MENIPIKISLSLRGGPKKICANHRQASSGALYGWCASAVAFLTSDSKHCKSPSRQSLCCAGPARKNQCMCPMRFTWIQSDFTFVILFSNWAHIRLGPERLWCSYVMHIGAMMPESVPRKQNADHWYTIHPHEKGLFSNPPRISDVTKLTGQMFSKRLSVVRKNCSFSIFETWTHSTKSAPQRWNEGPRYDFDVFVRKLPS